MLQTSLALRLLGGVTVITNDRPASGSATQPKRLAVLAILAHAYPSSVTRERIVGLVWPEQDESGARRLLTQALYEIRRELGPTVISGTGRDLSIDPAAMDIDLLAFRSAIAEGNASAALDLYRGAFLDGFHLRDADEFERWSSSVRQEIQQELRKCIEASASAHELAGEFRLAAMYIERLLMLTPHDAATVLRAIELYERSGDPGAASRVIEVYERRMREDLELAPDAQVTERATRLGKASSSVEARVPLHDTPLPHADIPKHSVANRAAHRGAWMGFGAVGVAALLLFLGLHGRIPTAYTAPTVSVAPFDAGSDTAAQRVAALVRPLITANLNGAGGTRVDTAAGLAARGRLSGAISVTGRSVRIDVSLRAHEGDKETRASITGALDSTLVLAEQISLELLPVLYANLNREAHGSVVRGLRNVSTAQHYLEGESALRRAAFDSAYLHLRAATELDSSNAFLWYRRAVAAEEAHHIEEAERTAIRADELSATLAPREKALVHAYRVWRSGNTRAADSLYRALLVMRPDDAEGWFQFAEVAYHGGTLIGEPLDASRDAWNRAVSLDSSNFPALMHAIRLEARAGDLARVQALITRAKSASAREPFLSEVLAVAAAAGDKKSFTPAELQRLDSMPDASVQFVHAIIASFVERPDLAWPAAVRLTAAKRPDAVRSEGFGALAHLAMSRGETALADVLLDTLAQRNLMEASWVRGYFATLPFLQRDSARMERAERELASSTARAPAAPLYLELSVNASATDIIRRYIESLLRQATSGAAPASLGCTRLLDGAPRALCTDMERGLLADRLARDGRPHEALAQLDSMNMRVPYQLAGRSVFFARTRERFLRAQLLERLGRLAEAYDWYAAVPYTARLDYVYLAPSHLGRARIRERQGDMQRAAWHYQRAAALLEPSDEGASALKQEAMAGLARTRG